MYRCIFISVVILLLISLPVLGQGVPSPDLVVTSVEVTDADGPEISFRYVIKNLRSTVARAPWTNSIYLSVDTDITPSDYKIKEMVYSSDIDGFGEAGVRGTVLASDVPGGEYYLGIIVDAKNEVWEYLYEDNNTGYCSAPKVSMPYPDFIVTTVNVDDGEPPGYEYSYTIKNVGDGPWTEEYLISHVYLSNDTQLGNGDDFLLHKLGIQGGLAPGETFSGSWGFSYKNPNGIPEGDYYLGIWVNKDKEIEEAVDNNNTGYDGLTTVHVWPPIPDLHADFLQVTDKTGPEISFSYTIENFGTKDVNETRKDKYFLIQESPYEEYSIGTSTFTQNIPKNDYITIQQTITVEGVPEGLYRLKVHVDWANDIAEAYEENNVHYYPGGYEIYIPPSSTDVEDEEVSQVPTSFKLHQNHPNPFNPETQISYELSETSHVRLSIYNLNGKQIKSLVNEVQQPGRYSYRWDGKDERGNDVVSGVYLCRLNSVGFQKTVRMVLIR